MAKAGGYKTNKLSQNPVDRGNQDPVGRGLVPRHSGWGQAPALHFEVISKLLEDVKSLSEERVKEVADFAAYLKEREEWETTAEILGNEELAQQAKRSRKAWAEGRKEGFVSLEELKAKLSV